MFELGLLFSKVVAFLLSKLLVYIQQNQAEL